MWFSEFVVPIYNIRELLRFLPKISEFFKKFTTLIVWEVNNLSRPGGYVTRVMWMNNKYKFPGLII